MAQSKILVDTNCYLRLAQSIQPLLCTPFGKQEYCLYVIPELNGELRSRHLRTKFSWVGQAEFLDERERFPTLSRKQKNSINDTFDFLWDFVQNEQPGPSRVDARFVAYAIELQIPVVTDDEDMIKLAQAFGAAVMRSLDLLKLMLDEGHIDIQKIQAIVAYWRHVGDTPGQLERRYRKLFGRKPP